MALYLLLPVALIFAFDLYKESWLKFLVVALPPLHILVAHGIDNLAQIANPKSQIPSPNSPFAARHLPFAICHLLFVTCLLAVLCATAVYPSLHNLYFNPAYARDDYRQIAADVAAIAHPGDAIVLNAPNQWEVFTYYYPDRDVYPAPYRPRPGEVEPFLAPLTERYRRLLVLYWGDAESDPQRLLETWLASHTYQAADRWYGRVRLATYGVARLPEEPAVALDACYGENIYLRGYALSGDQFLAGDILPVTLFWETLVPIPERYKVTVQLLDGTGKLVAQRDTEPANGLTPTTLWQPGQLLADRYGLALPLDLPPGHYTLITGLYHLTTGERLPVVLNGEPPGDHLVLSSVGVAQ